MESSQSLTPQAAATSPIAALRRFNRPRAAQERCELCSAALAPEHQHLLDPLVRQLLCACDACALLFSTKQGTRYRRVPRRIERWLDFHLDDERWSGLGVPISLAFFFYSTPGEQVLAMYPSPGGAIEAAIPVDVWEELVNANPVLGELEPDVEALLVNRVEAARDYYRAPIDKCYELVGLIRLHWRGLSGGKDAWDQIGEFFASLRSRATEVRGDA